MILLIRHCKPKIDYSRCDYKQVLSRIDEYNITDSIETDEILPLLNQIRSFLQRQNSIIFSSNMPRALITAKKLFEDRQDIIFDSKFIEFDLSIVPLPIVKLKFGTWATISRVLWFVRLLNSDRSIVNEIRRSKECAELIYKKAKEGFSVALVAHGMLNMFIEKHLKSRGYSRTSKTKNGFFSITKLQIRN